MMHRIAIASALLAVLLAVGIRAAAKPGDPPTVYKVVPKAVTAIKNGKVICYEGVADSAGQHFFLETMSIVQPIAVTLVAMKPGGDVSLQLLKDRWDTPHRTGSTKSTGRTMFQVRTQGEMKILVTAPTPTPFALSVWVGDDIKPPMRTPFVSMDAYRKRHPEAGGFAWSRYQPWAIGGLLLVGGAIGGMFVARKRGRA